jgi:hypothetical protein
MRDELPDFETSGPEEIPLKTISRIALRAGEHLSP